MKILPFVLAAGLAAASAAGWAQSARDNSARPCYDVNVQIDPRNRARVEQDCGRNVSRTMQAGQNNEASTVQRGDVNSNRVRQYGFDAQPRR